jgi:hypothetical protein
MTEAEYQHPTTIWLQPWCDKCERSAEDRTWCRDEVYLQCDECGAMPVKYVLASDQPQPRLEMEIEFEEYE